MQESTTQSELTTIQFIDVALIRESPLNPRQEYNHDKLEELKNSIKEKGVFQPILVRPAAKGAYEIVFGHRRLRAVKELKLSTIPAMVRALIDKEVLEAQLIENCNRTDIHVLEEAQGYLRLMRDFKYSADDIAFKLGKSKAYVYARLKLNDLPEEAKKEMWKGAFTKRMEMEMKIEGKDMAE